MLASVSIKGFKSLKSISLDLSGLNILVGPNNSGKSTVLQALILLKQSYKNPANGLLLNGPYVSLGDFGQVVYRTANQSGQEAQDERPSVSIGFSFFPKQRLTSYEPAARQPLIRRLEATTQGFRQVVAYPSQVLFEIEPNGQMKWPSEQAGQHSPSVGTPFMIGRLGLSGTPGSAQFKLAAAFESELQSALDRLFMIGPLRGMIDMQNPIEPQLPNEIGVRGEHLVTIIGRVQGHADYTTQLGKIRKWAEKFGFRDLILRLTDARSGETSGTLSGVDSQTGVGIDITNAGYGFNNLLPVIAQCFLAPKGSTIMIEEPEAHLHPAFQALLVDLFLDVLNFGNQLILTTHSEHLILRLQTRIAEGRINVNNVKLYAMSKGNGGSIASRITVDAKGLLSKMPAGFFEEGLNEALEHAQAVSKKEGK
jgi:energy-coupling factor transporter ATP-binding protein EcfA2